MLQANSKKDHQLIQAHRLGISFKNTKTLQQLTKAKTIKSTQ